MALMRIRLIRFTTRFDRAIPPNDLHGCSFSHVRAAMRMQREPNPVGPPPWRKFGVSGVPELGEAPGPQWVRS